MTAASGDCQRSVGSFNPVWCLRPQTPSWGKGASSGWLDHDVSPGSPSVSCAVDTSRGRRALDRRRVSSFDASAEPPSPRVGCMGQVREGRAASGGGRPSVRTTSKIQRLRRIFSGRSAVVTESPQTQAMTENKNRGVIAPVVISMAEMDPPLPVVIKKVKDGGVDTESLWKRRCRGAPVPGVLHLGLQRQTHTHWLALSSGSPGN